MGPPLQLSLPLPSQFPDTAVWSFVHMCLKVVRSGQCTGGEPQTEKHHLDPMPPPLVRKNQWGDRQPPSEHAGGQGRCRWGLQPHCG